MEQLPQSLSYSASKQALRMNRFQCRPTGTDNAGPGDTFRIKLPSKSLVNLSSFNLCFNLELSGLTDDAANFTNAKMPFSHSLFSSVRVYIGSQLVSGGLSTHYDLLYMGLVKASAGEDWCRSRYNDHARGLIENRDDITAFHTRPTATFTTKRGYYCMTDFLGAFRANGSKAIIDTSLWGEVDIEFTLNNASCIAKNAAGTALRADGGGFVSAANNREIATAVADISYKIQDIEGYVECITQTTPLYVKLITMLLDSKEQIIRFPYQNFVSTIVQGGKNARLQVNSGCIDAMVVLPLHASYNNNKSIVGVEHDLSALRYKFTACSNAGTPITIATDANAFSSVTGANMQIQIGSDTFPKIPINNYLQVSDITTNSLFSNSLYSQNLLFNGNTDATTSAYSRSKFLSENFVWVQSFSDGEGWATKVLTGIDSASQNLDVIVNANCPAGGSVMISALLTSLLVFDTRTGQVSVVQ
jgi:hypothetical protein